MSEHNEYSDGVDIGFLSNVAGDLEYLAEKWDQEIDINSLRVSSSVLRRLLTERGTRGNLIKAWRMVGLEGEPLIPTYNLYPILAWHVRELWAPSTKSELMDLFNIKGRLTEEEVKTIVPRSSHLVFAAPGGAEYKGAKMAACSVLIGWPDINKPDKAFPEIIRLCDFVKSPCLFVFGETITRSALTTYIVNKAGGAHYDRNRNMFKTQDRAFVLLDIFRATWRIGFGRKGENRNIDPIYFELLSTGQSISNSYDVKKLREVIASLTSSPVPGRGPVRGNPKK